MRARLGRPDLRRPVHLFAVPTAGPAGPQPSPGAGVSTLLISDGGRR